MDHLATLPEADSFLMKASATRADEESTKAEDRFELEERLRLVIETTPALVHSSLPDGFLDFFNRRWLEYLGRSLEDVQGWGWTAVIHPEDLAGMVDKWREALATGEPFEAEARVRRADGVYRWFLHRKVPLHDNVGNIVKWYGSSIDIEDRKLAAQRVRENERELQQLIDLVPQHIFVVGPDGSCLYANKVALQYLDCALRDIQGANFPARVVHPDDLNRLTTERQRGVLHGASFEIEARILGNGGQYRWFLLRSNPLRDEQGGIIRWYVSGTDIEDRKHVEERFRIENLALAKANAALRGCLDALASVPELDDFLGQVMAAITRQLGAASSTLRMLSVEQNTLTLELLYQDGRVVSPAEAKYPEYCRSLSLNEQRVATLLERPTTVIHILDPCSLLSEDHCSYLLGLNIKTLLIIPLTSGGQANGQLDFRFTEERDFNPEELEIARALAAQASLAIQLTRLGKAARQSAVLEERNRLAGEIHDSLAQSFAGIYMQLELAQEEMATKEGASLGYIRHALETAKFGLAEARRSVHSLRSNVARESGFVTVLQRLVERSNLAGRLRCDFRFNRIPEESLRGTVQHQLLRIAQEAISNAVRHGKPTLVTVCLFWDPPNLILQVTDNGSGISSARLEESEGFGLDSMRDRAARIDAKLEIQTTVGHGTSIIVTVPIS
jgi:PAS domain S-box-containing protein